VPSSVYFDILDRGPKKARPCHMRVRQGLASMDESLGDPRRKLVRATATKTAAIVGIGGHLIIDDRGRGRRNGGRSGLRFGRGGSRRRGSHGRGSCAASTGARWRRGAA
jgi:hypothetical protein